VRERVVDRLVTPDVEPAVPRALDQRGGRRDEEEEVHDLAEAREEVAARFLEFGAKLSKRKRSISRCDISPRCALRAM
jgi:hypothetical protein